MKRQPLKSKEVLKVLKKIGFFVSRQRGSHIFLKHPDGRATVVPVHKGEEIGIGLFLKILKDIDISKEDFFKILGK